VVAAGSLLPLIMVRPWWWGSAAAVVPFAIVLAWWLSIAPSNTRNWQPDVARLPSAAIDGHLVTIQNVRDFAYPSPTAVVERWEKRTYDLDQVVGFDMFLSSWGARGIAHTISSWEFSDGRHLAISIETRKEVGETYSPVAGFFRQYELYYVVADERDVIGVRTNYRGEQVYLYPLRTPRDRVRRALLEYVESMNRLATEPAFYNAGTDNCTTTIRTNMQHMGASMPLDWRYFVNGYLNELLYEHNVVDTSRPLADWKTESLIVARAKAADGDQGFSRRIREGIVVPLRFDESGAPARR
jgi:hypothetical protein